MLQPGCFVACILAVQKAAHNALSVGCPGLPAYLQCTQAQQCRALPMTLQKLLQAAV